MLKNRARIAVVATAAASSIVPWLADAEASGYSLKQQSATALGAAIAGTTAGTGEVSGVFFNPAQAARLSRFNASASMAYLDVRSAPGGMVGTTAAGAPAGGGDGGSDVVDNALVPTLHLGGPLGEGGLAAGLSVTAPWGLETSYEPGWAGRYHALDTSLAAINVAPVVAYDVGFLQIGAGAQLQHLSGEMTSAIDFGTLGAQMAVPGAVPGGADGRVGLDGDDWAIGYTLGAIVEPAAGTRIGLSYRSRMRHRLRGGARFELDAGGVGAAIRAHTGLFSDTGFEIEITTPERVALGVRQEVGAGVRLLGELRWTRWSRMDDVRVRFDGPQGDEITRHAWADTWFAALGAEWDVSPAVTLRAGVAHDQSPMTARTRTPRIPDADRTWVSVGVSYEPARWIRLDAGYTRFFMPDAAIDQRAGDPGNALRGDLEGSVSSRVDIIGMQLGVRF